MCVIFVSVFFHQATSCWFVIVYCCTKYTVLLNLVLISAITVVDRSDVVIMDDVRKT